MRAGALTVAAPIRALLLGLSPALFGIDAAFLAGPRWLGGLAFLGHMGGGADQLGELGARESRDQIRNRETARVRLADLIRRATVVPKTRKPTKLSRAAKERRLDSKKHHARTKQQRSRRFED